jgi:hypothetical protein
MRPRLPAATAPLKTMMTTTLKRFAAAAVAAFGFSLPASATTYSTDFSDLWWAGQTENGWGINFIQQSEIIFATMFVYGNDSTPRWYVASALAPSPAGSTTFSGQLFRTTGPYFGGPWNANVTPVPVGNMTVAFNSPTTATLSYSVDGVNVTKNITRQTWRNIDASGVYGGGVLAVGSSCGGGSPNGPIAIFGELNITQSGNAVAMRVNFFNANNAPSICNFNGTLSTAGKVASISGQFSCTFGGVAGNTGTFNISALEVTTNGLNGNFTAQDQFCTYNVGRFGGLRDLQ